MQPKTYSAGYLKYVAKFWDPELLHTTLPNLFPILRQKSKALHSEFALKAKFVNHDPCPILHLMVLLDQVST